MEDKREENKETRQDRRQRNRRSARYKEQTQDKRCRDREKIETDQNKDRGRVLDRCFDFLKKNEFMSALVSSVRGFSIRNVC